MPITRITDEMAQQFLNDIEVSPKSILGYRCGVRAFLPYQDKLHFDNDFLVNLDKELAKPSRHLSRRSRHFYVTCAKQVLEWADDKFGLPETMNLHKVNKRLRDLRRRDRAPYKPRVPDPQIWRLRTHFHQIPLPAEGTPTRLELLRNRAVMDVLFSTGMRRAECAALDRNQVADGTVSEFVLHKTKGGRFRTVFLDPPAQASIRAYCAERADKTQPLFLVHRNIHRGHRMNDNGVLYLVKKAAIEIGLSTNTCPHMIRHWLASDMLNNGVRLEDVQMYLGHVSIATTRTVYAHTMVSTLRDAISQYRQRKHMATRRRQAEADMKAEAEIKWLPPAPELAMVANGVH